MASLKQFLKGNKKTKENTKYAATKSLCDENGEPLEWEIKPLTTAESENLREECTIEVPITGKPGQYRNKLNTSKYLSKMIVSSVVYPDLEDSELQDSYGVLKPEDLVKEMIDDPGEYSDFALFLQRYNGFDTDEVQEKVDTAKN